MFRHVVKPITRRFSHLLTHCVSLPLKKNQRLTMWCKTTIWSCTGSWGALTSSCSTFSTSPIVAFTLHGLYPHQQHQQRPYSTLYIIILSDDGANYLLVHCSESNEEHRQHISHRRALITSTSPIELNDDGAADPATDSAERNACLAHVRNGCNGRADGTDHSGSAPPYCPSV